MTEIFLGGEALAAGRVTRQELANRYTAIYRGVYISNDAAPSLRQRSIAAWLAVRRKGVIAGSTAAALHGCAWVDPAGPIEVAGTAGKAQHGLLPRRDRIADDEVVMLSGLPVTTRVRTAFDVGRHLERGLALARLDAMMWNREFSVEAVRVLASRYPHASGVRQLDELLPLVDGGAATPRESRIRLSLLDAGFPRPETRVPVIDREQLVDTLELGWPEFKVALTTSVVDSVRTLEDLGWLVLHIGADDRPTQWLARTEAALLGRGCRLPTMDLHRFYRTLAA